MKANRSWRWGIFVMAVAGALALAGCSGGGGGASVSSGGLGIAAPAALDVTLDTDASSVSVASAVSASVAVTPADPSLHPSRNYPGLQHLWVTVVKVALLPVEGESPDLVNGENVLDDGPEDHAAEHPTGGGTGFVVFTPDPPVVFDLLNPPNGRQVAKFFNGFKQVPAGTYGKIRVYYSQIEAEFRGGVTVPVHPTANYHFDIHFKNGPLVIPVGTDTTYPDSWIRFFKVRIFVVGLKIHITGNHKWDADDWDCRKRGKIILRPQVFAEFEPPILYSIGGRAKDVGVGNFNIDAAGRTIHTVYGARTSWGFSDNIFSNGRVVPVDNTLGIASLRNTAFVEAIGRFLDGTLDFKARDVLITFPAERRGVVDNGWRADDTFVLRSPSDNVVYPMPDRFTAYYDNAVAPYAPLTDASIDNNVRVKARGYNAFDPSGNPIGIDAFWISVGP